MELSVRASNCLESAKIHTVGDLAKLTEGDLLKVRSFGKTSLREVKRKLQDLGLSLGMTIGAADHAAQAPDEVSSFRFRVSRKELAPLNLKLET